MQDLFQIDEELKSKSNNLEKIESTKPVETAGIVMQHEDIKKVETSTSNTNNVIQDNIVSDTVSSPTHHS